MRTYSLFMFSGIRSKEIPQHKQLTDHQFDIKQSWKQIFLILSSERERKVGGKEEEALIPELVPCSASQLVSSVPYCHEPLEGSGSQYKKKYPSFLTKKSWRWKKLTIQLKNNQHLGGKVSTAAASDYQIEKSCSFPLVLLVASDVY